MKKPIILKKAMTIESNLRYHKNILQSYNAYGCGNAKDEKRVLEIKETIKLIESGKSAICEKIDDVIKEIEGKATARTITAADIIEELYTYENTLGIPKKYMEGIKVTINPHAQQFPGAYKYTPMSTKAQAVYKNGSWRIFDVYRGKCTNTRISADLPKETKDKIIEKYQTIK